jgi:hypothetical protein
MYIFAKFVTDHIFLQNRDKINIKNSITEATNSPSITPVQPSFVNEKWVGPTVEFIFFLERPSSI